MSNKKSFLVRSAAWAARTLPISLKLCLYRRPFLARLIRRLLNAAVPAGIQEITIASGNLAGMRMALDLHAEKDYWLGTYEPALQEAARKFIQPGMTVYDIGANIGYITLMAARISGESGKVCAFEALPANISRLKENVRLNNLEKQVKVIPGAVVKKSGSATFLIHDSGAMGKALGSAGRDETYGTALQVAGIALDDFIYKQGNPAPDVVKMDIEGGEGPALAGMRHLMKEASPIFLIELHGEKAASEVWDILSTAGYTLHAMRKGYPRIQSLEDMDWKAYIITKTKT